MSLGKSVVDLWGHWFVRLGTALVTSVFALWGFLSSASYRDWPFLCGVIGGVVVLAVVGSEFYKTHTLEEQLAPHARMLFDLGRDGFFDTTHKLQGGTIRHIRVAVENYGGAPLADVGVMVVRFEPSVSGVYPYQQIRTTHGVDGECRTTVNPGSSQLKFFELCTQQLDEHNRTCQMFIDFSGGRRVVPVGPKRFMVWVVPDCANAGEAIKVVLEMNDKTGQYDARKALYA